MQQTANYKVPATQPPQGTVGTVTLTHTLAAELASGLMSTQEILDEFNLSPQQLKQIISDPHFKAMYQEAKAIWAGTGNVRERIRAKAALLLEDSLLPLYGIIHNHEQTSAARIEAFAKLMSVSDMVPSRAGSGGPVGEKFNLTINIGDDRQTVTIQADTQEALTDGR